MNLGYLSQHASELGSRGTVLEAAQRATGLTPNKARALLGRFLFSGEEAEKPMEGLSGGERRRLSLAVVVASGANVLILDEPTNHLDLDAREALEDALQAFEGAVLLVSHDRALLDAVGSRTVAFEDGRLRSYDGGWAEYARVREERREAAAAAGAAAKLERRTARRERRAEGAPSGQRRRAARADGTVEERAAADRRAGAGGRTGGDRPEATGGRAGRPGDVEQPVPHGAEHGEAREGEARRGAGVRAWEEASGAK